MGQQASQPVTPPPPTPPPPPPPPPPPRYPLDLESAREFLEEKVAVSFTLGGLGGSAVGYYVGNMTALYGYSGALGLGMGSTAFFGTVYGLRHARQQDDLGNYAASGAINGLWIITGITRSLPRGVVGSALGAALGVGVKLGGDALFRTSREAWIAHRIHTLEFSKPRVLESRKPMFHPNDSRLPRGGIIPIRDSAKKADLEPPKQAKEPEKKVKGWLW